MLPSRSDPGLSRTDWSMLGRLHSGNRAREEEAMDLLVRRYWPAVYAFIRRTGRDVHESADLTQAFITDVVLGRKLMHGADPAKGRFRHLLLQSLRNFLHEQHRYATRQKRAPSSGAIVGLEETGVSARSNSPDAAFDAAWCRGLVHRVLESVADGCRRDGLEVHWGVFEARVVRPMLDGTPAPEYAVLAETLDLPSPAHAANLLITVKRRFARALRREIAATVVDPSEIDDELSDLLGGLAGA